MYNTQDKSQEAAKQIGIIVGSVVGGLFIVFMYRCIVTSRQYGRRKKEEQDIKAFQTEEKIFDSEVSLWDLEPTRGFFIVSSVGFMHVCFVCVCVCLCA